MWKGEGGGGGGGGCARGMCACSGGLMWSFSSSACYRHPL